MGWGVDGKGTEFPTKPFDYEAARASMSEEALRAAAMCVHDWPRESYRVDVSLRDFMAFPRLGEAVECRLCGSLLVLFEHQG